MEQDTPIQTPPAQPPANPAQQSSEAGQLGLAHMLGLGDFGIEEQVVKTEDNGMKVVAVGEEKEKEAVEPTKAEEAEEKVDEKREKDIYDTALEALNGEQQPEAKLTDEVKAYLASKGIEDIDAKLGEFASLTELASQYKGKAESYDQMLTNLANLPAEIGEAITLAGQGEDYTKALIPLTKGVTVSKEGKKIDKYALVDHYFPNKFSAEQVEAIKGGDADQTLIDAHDLFREQAIERHEARRKNFAEVESARAQENKESAERMSKAVADAIAHVRKDKMRATFLDKKTIDDFTSGKLVNELLYNKDGTPKLESLAHLIDGIHLPKMVERMRAGALAKGRNEGQAKVMSAMTAQPDTKTFERQGSPTPKDNGDALKKAVEDGQLAVAAAFG